MRNYDEAGVSRHLLKLRKVTSIDSVNKVITINPDTPIGNHCWGKIDFLEHHCGYHIVREKTKKIVVSSDNNSEKKDKEKKVIKKMRNNNNVEHNKPRNNEGKAKFPNNGAKAKAKAKK